MQPPRVVTLARAKGCFNAFASPLPVLCAAFTGHAWKDYFLTLPTSRNLVDVHCLAFTPRRAFAYVHLPAGVLLRSLYTVVAGPGREELSLPVFLEEPALKDYTLVKLCSGLPQLSAATFLPGRIGSEFVAHYFLLRRKSDSP